MAQAEPDATAEAIRLAPSERTESCGSTKPLLFLDLEACSLDPCSWPFEISMAWFDGDRIVSRSRVIAPRPDWPLHAWSEAAADVHGISLARARAGMPADRCAAETDALAPFEVVSDNPHWDQLWLDRLRAGRPRIPVASLRATIAARLASWEADAVALALLRETSLHRARADAARLARAWAASAGALALCRVA